MNNMLIGVININDISMRDQNSPPPYDQYVNWGKNTNYISVKVQNSPPAMSNMLVGVIRNFILMEGSTFATLYEQYRYVGWRNNINLIFMRESKFATSHEQYVDWGNNINFIFMRDQNSPPRYWAICWLGVIKSPLSS